MSDEHNHEGEIPPIANENVVERRPNETMPPPAEPDRSMDARAPDAPASTIPGWPQDRFHPVYGKRSFVDPNDFAINGGDEGDWRFKRASDADAARTETEAQMAHWAYMQRRLDAVRESGEPVNQSVQAHERAAEGHFDQSVEMVGDRR